MLKKLLAVITILCMGIMLVPVGLSAADSPAEFKVNDTGNPYTDLNAAIAAAKSNDVIYLSATGTLAAGSYTIPSGVTLYIPRSADSTPQGVTPEHLHEGGMKTSKPFLTLTLLSGVHITVNGKIEVGGEGYCIQGGGSSPQITDTYGHIIMGADSNITLENGSNLYAWGFITGEGTVEAKSGSNVYEFMQWSDARGGSATAGHNATFTDKSNAAENKSKRHFPVSQYYVQNVEARLIINPGAKDNVYSASYTGGGWAEVSQVFIGAGGMYQPDANSVITKYYDPAKDKLHIEISGGTVSIGSIKYGINLSWSQTTFDTKDYVCPINNTALHIKSGSMLKCNKHIELTPDSGIFIEKNSIFKIESGGVVYVIDTANWDRTNPDNTKTSFVSNSDRRLIAVRYTPTRKKARTATTSAFIDVAGLLDAQGDLKTTVTGANITGQHGGKVKYANADNTTLELWHYQRKQIDPNNNLTGLYSTLPLSSKLKNGSNKTEKPYTDTAGRVGEMTYTYVADEPGHLAKNGVWQEGDIAFYDVSFSAGSGTGTQQPPRPGGGVWTELPKDAKITLPGNPFTAPNGYYFSGWLCDADNQVYQPDYIYPMPAQNVTFTAQWAEQIPIKFEANTAKTSGSMPENTVYQGVPLNLPANEFICDGWTFDGWNTHPNGTGTRYENEAEINDITGPLTLYAQWKPADCTVIFDANDGTGTMTAQTFEFNKAAALSDCTFTCEGYILAGWGTNADGSGDIYAPGGYYCFTNPSNMQVTLYALWLPEP